MAKTEMKCPFSGKMCRNCPVYIGRHYFLCYKPQYRGYIQTHIRKNGFLKHRTSYRIPSIATRSLDPFAGIAVTISTDKGG